MRTTLACDNIALEASEHSFSDKKGFGSTGFNRLHCNSDPAKTIQAQNQNKNDRRNYAVNK